MDDSFNSKDLGGESIEDGSETKNQSDREKGKGKNGGDEDNEEPEIKNKKLINSISNTLTTILEENKKLENYKEIIKNKK